jgi:hypothetical protein
LGVQTSILFSTTVQTKKVFKFKSDPRPSTKNFKIVKPDWTYAYGDGSVVTPSALIPGIKWAQDYKSGVRGSKPVNFVELCGDYNRRNSVFEGSSKRVTKNSYFGISCDCKGTKWLKTDGSGCNHVKLVSDSKSLDFILNSAIDYQKAASLSSRSRFENNSDSFLRNYIDRCSLLND